MVKIVRRELVLQYFRLLYPEPWIGKIKVTWKFCREYHPLLSVVIPLSLIVNIPLLGLLTYTNYSLPDPWIPKYYDHIMIFRPDDARVKTIRKDDTLAFANKKIYFQI